MGHIMRPKWLMGTEIRVRHSICKRRYVTLSIIMIVRLSKMEISRDKIMPRTPKTRYIFIRIRIIHPYKMIFSGLIIKLEIF